MTALRHHPLTLASTDEERPPPAAAVNEHRPVVFRPRDPADARALTELVGSRPGLRVLDTISAQLRELAEVRRPAWRRDPGLVESVMAREVAGASLHDYGAWVFLPWRDQLVHLLDDAEFAEVRGNRNCNKITSEEQQRLRQLKVGVVGLSAGAAVAVTVAMEGSCGQLRLADFDSLELSNLNRVRAGVADIGTPKAIVAARTIAEFDPFLDVRVLLEGVTEENVDEFLTAGGRLDLVVEECDSLEVKLLVRERARAHGIPVLMVTSEGGLVDVERFDREPDRPVLHGLTAGLDVARLRGLSVDEKVPIVLRMLGQDRLSARMAASLLEVDSTLITWPQLASAVALGGAVAADTWRRIALAEFHSSGQYAVDPERALRDPPTEPDASGSRPQPTQGPARVVQHAAAYLDRQPAARWRPSPELIEDLVAAGCSAPSGGNSQPWTWFQRDDRLLLGLDAQRTATGLDQGLAGTVALGAALENVVLQAHRHGLEVAVDVPAAEDTELVAALRLSPHRDDGGNLEPHATDFLAEYIPRRRTDRSIVPAAGLSPGALAAIDQAVRSVPGAGLDYLLDPATLRVAADVLARGERLRMLHPRLHADMISEVRWTPEDAAASGDGIDLRTLPLTAGQRARLGLVRDPEVIALLRRWDAASAWRTSLGKPSRPPRPWP